MKNTEEMRVHVKFHKDNPEEEKAFRYIQEGKRKGISFVNYITGCVLEHEEGEKISLSRSDLEELAALMSKKILEDRKASKENKKYDIS